MANDPDDGPFTGDFDSPWLRKLLFPQLAPAESAIAPLSTWAAAHGFKFRASSPTGQPGSVLVQIWNGTVSAIGEPSLGTPGFEMDLYWDGDTADDQALDRAAAGITAALSAFGPSTVTAAPPGTKPRVPSTNLWKR